MLPLSSLLDLVSPPFPFNISQSKKIIYEKIPQVKTLQAIKGVIL
jgi:hypothetical protein